VPYDVLLLFAETFDPLLLFLPARQRLKMFGHEGRQNDYNVIKGGKRFRLFLLSLPFMANPIPKPLILNKGLSETDNFISVCVIQFRYTSASNPATLV